MLSTNAVTFFVFAVLVYCCRVDSQNIPPEELTNILRYHQQCREQSHISDAEVRNVLLGDFTYTPQLGQHLFCVSKRIGFQDENGRINRNVLRQKLSLVSNDQQTIDRLVNQCSVQQSTSERTAVKTAECFYNDIRRLVMGK